MKNDDVELIQRVLAGDDNAFSTLVKKYQKPVHALVWRKVGDFHIAEEITQDAFLKAYKELATLKKPHHFARWLSVIATRGCIAWLRKKRLSTQSLEDTSHAQLEKATYSGYVIQENERTEAETQREVVQKLLAKLRENERTVITLHYFGEMTHEEISEFLGASVGTIKSRLRRAQQRLKREEPMVREALSGFQIAPNFTENVMREISLMTPTSSTGGSQRFVPWAIAASILAVVLLVLGIGYHYSDLFELSFGSKAPRATTAPKVAKLAKTLETAKIAFTSWRDGTEEIYTMNPDGSNQVNLTRHFSPALNREPVWSPTGERILFVSNRDGTLDLYLMDVDGQNVKRVFENVRHRQHPAWHPNGKRIAYLDYGEQAIYTANIDGRESKRIAIAGKDGGKPVWSPDGSEIAFVFVEDRNYQVRIINVKTRIHRTLKHPEPQVRMIDPAWSPEGNRIAYASFPFLFSQIDHGTIYVMNRDGTELQQVVAKVGPRAARPTWSPHGDEILYQQRVDGDKQIFKFHLSSRETTQLTHQNYNFNADWFDPTEPFERSNP